MVQGFPNKPILGEFPRGKERRSRLQNVPKLSADADKKYGVRPSVGPLLDVDWHVPRRCYALDHLESSGGRLAVNSRWALVMHSKCQCALQGLAVIIPAASRAALPKWVLSLHNSRCSVGG